MGQGMLFAILVAVTFMSGTHRLFVGSAEAQLGAAGVIAGDAAVTSIVNDLKNSVATILSQLSADVSKNSFEIRQHLELLAQTLDQLGQALIGKTFKELDASQQDFFRNLDKTLDSLENKANLTLGRVDDVLKRTNDAIGTLPFANRHPRVLKYTPAYVLGTAASAGSTPDDEVTFKIEGSWLGNGKPTLTFSGKSCVLQTKLETSLVFACPSALFAAGSRVQSRDGALTVFKEKTWWETVKGAFRAVGAGVEYKLGAFVVPPAMGTYKARAILTTTTTEEVPRRTQDFYHGNGHCEGARPVVWTVNATPGWKIDVNSIQVGELTKNGDTQNHGAINRGESGFQLSGIVRNTGNCVRALGQTVSKDARGWLGVVATYREYRSVTGTAGAGPWSGVLRWGNDVAVELPVGATSFAIEITQLDGKVFVEDKAATRAWYSVSYDPNSRQLIVRPKDLRTAIE